VLTAFLWPNLEFSAVFCERCGERLCYIGEPGCVFVNYSKGCDIQQLRGPKGCRIFLVFWVSGRCTVPNVYVSVPSDLNGGPVALYPVLLSSPHSLFPLDYNSHNKTSIFNYQIIGTVVRCCSFMERCNRNGALVSG
jgi:hypothetical protein